MKRIAVLSLVFDNYGTRLQSYALSKVLQKIAGNKFEIDFIDIETPWDPRNERFVIVKLVCRKIKSYGFRGLYKIYELFKWFVGCRSLRKRINQKELGKKRHNLFEHIISLIPYTTQCYTCQDIRDGKLPDYEAIIVGSDQVWNGKKVGDQDVFMLDFATAAKKLTYAASFGMTNIPQNMLDDYRNRISAFSSLLIREKEGVELCSKLGRNDAELVLDPTLLLDAFDYDAVFSNSEIDVSDDYVLVYSLNYSYKIYSEVKKICQHNHCRMIVLKRSVCPPDVSGFAEEFLAASPETFLNLIKKAKIVVTNSYHALLFSIIYRKNFYLYLDNSDEENSRLLTVAKMFNLEKNVFWESGSLPCCIQDTVYAGIESILETERTRSITLLRNSLENI